MLSTAKALGIGLANEGPCAPEELRRRIITQASGRVTAIRALGIADAGHAD
jgi:hypothetical protein